MLNAFSQAAHRRDVQRRSHARLGRRLGQRPRGRRDREQLRRREGQHGHARRRRNPAPTARSRSATPGRTRERKSTRASASPAGRWPICATPSSSTTGLSKGWCPASITCTATYETPFGFGRLRIDDGVAYGETVRHLVGGPAFRGLGRAARRPDVAKSTGAVTGAAWVGWDGNYSFNADGSKIPVESLKTAAFPTAPLSGVLQFNAAGTGTFDVPRYDVNVRVDDLFAGDEGSRPVDGTPGAARRPPDAGLQRRLETPGRRGLRPHCDDRRHGRGTVAAVPGHVARSVPPLLRAAALALHHRGGRRHRARRGRAGRHRSPDGRNQGRAARHEAVRLSRQQPRSPDERVRADRTRARPGRRDDRSVPAVRRRHRTGAQRHRRPARFDPGAQGRRATPTSASSRGSSGISAVRGPRGSRRR